MKKIIALTFVATLLGTSSMVAYAADPSGPSASPSLSVLEDIDNWTKHISNTLDAIAQSMFTVPKDIGQYIANLQNINDASQAQTDVAKNQTENLVDAYASTGSPSKSIDNAYKLSTKPIGNFSALSAYSLVGLGKYKGNYYSTYSSDQQKAAQAYSTFLSGAAIPMTAPEHADSTQEKKKVNMARTMSAIQSLDAYNISKVYAERYPTIDAKKSGVNIPTPNGNISKLGLVRYELQHSINNPEWYTKMSTASPATVDRQMLFVLAAGVSELYRVEQNQEQMILTQTATNTATLAMAQQLTSAMSQVPSS